MQVVEQIIFIVILALTGYLLFTRSRYIIKAINLGKPLNRSDQPGKRWRNVFLLAFGQKKMFRRIIPAVFHFIIYAGFIIINIEVLEFTIDGLTGNHRTFAHILTSGRDNSQFSDFYNVLMNLFELLALGVLVACIIFLIRRNILKMKRFSGTEMRSWPKLDANLILIFEIVLMAAILLMNGADQALQNKSTAGYINTGDLFISRFFIYPIINNLNASSLIVIERSAWWFHIIGIFAFAVYVTYSKHLHIILAFPNTYYSNLKSPAEIPNMEAVSNEVKSMMGMATTGTAGEEVPTLGARDVSDLTWKNLMDAFTCTECGRCTSVCPANITGKLLSPRKIMMDVRDRAEEIVNSGNSNQDKSLFDKISREELYACTTCNACIDVCPVSIDPVSIIIEMRRYTVMEESSAPAEWNMMFNNIETSSAPWKFPASDRFKWAEELKK